MEWTEESTLDFINSYRNKEILWDAKHPKYYNKIKKHDAWEELAVEFRTTVDECKKKINVLLSGLRREKAKIKKSHGTGKGLSDIYESSWFAFKSLLFLWDKNKVRETQSTIVHEEEGNDEKEISGDEGTLADNDKNSAVQENRESIENVPKRKATPSTEKKSDEATPSRKRQKRNEDSEKLDKAFKILSEASANARNPQEQNEYQIFGNLVAKKLAKYSLELQSTVQQDIMLILFKADKTHLQQSSTNFYHSQSYRTHTLQSFFANSVPQHSQFEQYQDSQASSFTQQHSQVPSPAYNYANSSISDHSSRSTPVNSLPRQLLDMPDIELENLR